MPSPSESMHSKNTMIYVPQTEVGASGSLNPFRCRNRHTSIPSRSEQGHWKPLAYQQRRHCISRCVFCIFTFGCTKSPYLCSIRKYTLCDILVQPAINDQDATGRIRECETGNYFSQISCADPIGRTKRAMGIDRTRPTLFAPRYIFQSPPGSKTGISSSFA